jgi:hypothetical protein
MPIPCIQYRRKYNLRETKKKKKKNRKPGNQPTLIGVCSCGAGPEVGEL